MRLLFVCSGNTCRSPLAVAAWRACVRNAEGLAREKLAAIEADSAGLCAHEDERAACFARKLAHEWGESLEHHHASLFRPSHAEYDLIVTMTHDQSAVLATHFRLDPHRLRVLGAYLPRSESLAQARALAPLFDFQGGEKFLTLSENADEDILDPFGGSFEAYNECASQILVAVRELAKQLAISSN